MIIKYKGISTVSRIQFHCQKGLRTFRNLNSYSCLHPLFWCSSNLSYALFTAEGSKDSNMGWKIEAPFPKGIQLWMMAHRESNMDFSNVNLYPPYSTTLSLMPCQHLLQLLWCGKPAHIYSGWLNRREIFKFTAALWIECKLSECSVNPQCSPMFWCSPNLSYISPSKLPYWRWLDPIQKKSTYCLCLHGGTVDRTRDLQMINRMFKTSVCCSPSWAMPPR